MDKKDKKKSKRWRWLIVISFIIILTGLWQFTSELFLEKEKTLRSSVRKTVEETFPSQAAEVAASYGLHHSDSNLAVPDRANPLPHCVVLIHGLDDPGKVWMNLAPALANEGFDVWEMLYPNDQPIIESTSLFFEKLKGLKALGAGRITIVSHSMGGLVSREMLTNPELAYPEKARAGELPEVVELIMVATPNHGSELARFRVFTEFRDQWAYATKNKGHWLRGILDGAGEAKIDLLPGSSFLNTLNSRPHPEGVKMSVIAGVASPWDEEEIARFINSVRQKLPEDNHDELDDVGKFLKSAANGLGDGLVTVNSTMLQGIPHQTVPGTHLSMIRNIFENSERVPPAVPIIVEQLKQGSLSARGVRP